MHRLAPLAWQGSQTTAMLGARRQFASREGLGRAGLRTAAGRRARGRIQCGPQVSSAVLALVCARKKGASTSDSTAMSLMRMLREGPEVSLSGSPTVSPMTAACGEGGCRWVGGWCDGGAGGWCGVVQKGEPGGAKEEGGPRRVGGRLASKGRGNTGAQRKAAPAARGARPAPTSPLHAACCRQGGVTPPCGSRSPCRPGRARARLRRPARGAAACSQGSVAPS